MLLKRNGTLVGMPEGAFIRFIGAKNARYTCPMASTRNSFLRAAAPGSVRFRCDEAIASSIAKRRRGPLADKKRGAQNAPLETTGPLKRLLAARCGRRALRLHRQQQPRASVKMHIFVGGSQHRSFTAPTRAQAHSLDAVHASRICRQRARI